MSRHRIFWPRIPIGVQAHPRPGLWLTLGLLLFTAVWVTHLTLTSLSPPADNIEQLNWVHSLDWGYYKHPPLPTWLLWLPARWFGANAWTSYALGTAINLATLGVLWRLLAQLRGARFATIALLAILCISYYNAGLNQYNHNTLLAFWSAASAALCWKAVTSARMRWWTALGLALGLGMLTKYQIVVTIASVFVFWLSQRGWRDPRQRLGLMLAALIALLMFIPHLQWLRTQDFAPIRYATESSLGAHLSPLARMVGISNWLLDQLLNRALPAWILLGILIYRQRKADALRGATAPTIPARQRAGRALLLSWGLVPLLFMPLMGLATGSLLQMRWGTPFLLFAIPAVMELCASRVAWPRMGMRGALKAFVAIQLLLLLLSHLTSPFGPPAMRDRHWRAFDSSALARLVEAPARAALSGGPICVVSGPGKVAGALALRLTDHPLVLIDGRYETSPWVSADLVRRCGLLQLQQGAPLPGGTPVGALFPDLWWRVIRPVDAAAKP